jgi:hypothetical protein
MKHYLLLVADRIVAVVVFLFLLLVLYAPAHGHPPDAFTEFRVCGTPARDEDGRISRSSSVLAAYQRIHACPSTGLKTGACPGWELDHPLPLACGGIDAVSNLQWLPNVIKSAPGTLVKDRWERKVCAGEIVTMPKAE